MNDKNLHINQRSDGNYPEPDIPADDAWKAMDAMLTAQTPPPAGSGPGGAGSISAGFWKLALLIVIIGGLVFVAINKLSNKDDGVAVKQQKDLAATQSSATADTLLKKADDSNVNSISIARDSFVKNDTTTAINNNQNKLAPVESVPPVFKGYNNSDKSKISSANRPANGIESKASKNSLENNSTNANIIQPHNKLNNTFGSNKVNGIDTATSNISNTSDPGRISDNVIPAESSDKSNKSRAFDKESFSIRYNKEVIEKNTTAITKPPSEELSSSNPGNILKNLLAEQNKFSAGIKQKGTKNKSDGFFSDVNYGLQLNISIPLKSECQCNYFVDVNNMSRPYKLLIPGIWASKRLGANHQILLQFNPYQQYFAGSKTARRETLYPFPAPGDTLVSTFNVVKVMGSGGGIQYSYHFNKKWSAGIGVDYNTSLKALINEQKRKKDNGEILLNKTYGIKNSSDSVRYIRTAFVTASLNLMYDFKKFQVGARLLIPASNLSVDNSSPVWPVNGQLFFRWKINN